nr:hypothetical protein [Nonomuraea aurantiaca]
MQNSLSDLLSSHACSQRESGMCPQLRLGIAESGQATQSDELSLCCGKRLADIDVTEGEGDDVVGQGWMLTAQSRDQLGGFGEPESLEVSCSALKAFIEVRLH